jgi:hypothetical protein
VRWHEEAVVSGRRQAAGWLRATVTTVGVLLLGIVLLFIAARLPLGSEGEHFAGHFSVGVTVLLLLLAVLWAWPRPSSDQMRSMARRILAAGLALFGIGQLVEGVGAFGFRGNDQVNFLATVHDLALVGLVGVPIALAGALLWVMLALAARLGVGRSRWVPYALLALAILAFIAYVVLVVTDV